jgi:hypothetical protein
MKKIKNHNLPQERKPYSEPNAHKCSLLINEIILLKFDYLALWFYIGWWK